MPDLAEIEETPATNGSTAAPAPVESSTESD
jgi:hypothetical protein